MITNLKREDCLKILNSNYIAHMAYIYKNRPYIIPITYFYDNENLTVIGYTGEGHKTRALRENNAVALEIAEIKSANEWKSIIVHGTFEELEGPDAKYELHKFSTGVKNLINKQEKKEIHFIPEFSGRTNFEALPVIYHITIEEITGKQRAYHVNKDFSKTKPDEKLEPLKL